MLDLLLIEWVNETVHLVPAGYHSHFYKISQLVFQENELHGCPPGITGKIKQPACFFKKMKCPAPRSLCFKKKTRWLFYTS